MREDLLGRDSISDGLQHSDGDKQRIGTWGGVNHVKNKFFGNFARNDIDEEMCYVSFILELGCGRF